MLRAGGHLRSYTPPSAEAMYTGREQFAMGGDLKVHRGEAETMSYNPYLPEGGETIMFRGPSHDNGGMPIEYGSSPVEVEGGEPAVKLQDGTSGDSSLVVYGNLVNPKTGKKFKRDAAEISKNEAKQNKKIDRASKGLDNLDVNTSFDKLGLDTYNAIITGANMKLKQYAEDKMDLAALQSAINDTAEEYSLIADDLAKGKVKFDTSKDATAKYGTSLPKAAKGMTLDDPIQGLLDMLKKKGYKYDVRSTVRPGAKTAQGRKSRHAAGEAADVKFPKLGSDSYRQLLYDSEIANYMLNNGITMIDEYDPKKLTATKGTGPHIHFGYDKGTDLSEQFRQDATKLYRKNVNPNVRLQGSMQEVAGPNDNPKDKIKKFNSPEEAKAAGYKLEADGKYHLRTKGVAPEPKISKSAAARKDIPKQSRSPEGLYGGITPEQLEEYKKKNDWYDWTGFNPNDPGDVLAYEKAFNAIAKEYGSDAYLKEDDKFGQQVYSANITKNKNDEVALDTDEIGEINIGGATPPKLTPPYEGIINTLLPYIRPSDAEPLDKQQLIPEMYSLISNDLEPVYAQKINPRLQQPYDISLQDQMNANQADFNSMQRMVGGDPSALASLAAQKYAANSGVLGEQMRINQANKANIYNANINTMNAADLRNVDILDRQYERQAQAKSNTKATTLAALNSITDKYAKNKLDNRTLATYENLYNYRYDPSFRAQNMNPLAKFNTPTVTNKLPIYDASGSKIIGFQEADGSVPAGATPPYVAPGSRKTTTTKEEKPASALSRNGSIVKALKNL
jgi:hypothetical protein